MVSYSHWKVNVMTSNPNDSDPPWIGSNEQSSTGDGTRAAHSRKPLGPIWLAVALVVLAFAGYRLYAMFYLATPEKAHPVERLYLCSETHKTFSYKKNVGEDIPVTSPFSKKRTGYPCEPCYRTKKENVFRDQPYYVTLNKYFDKPGPTICPDCGHEVQGHNPDPRPVHLDAPSSRKAAAGQAD